MKTRLIKFTYWLISATISLLGFSACAATSKAAKTDSATPEVEEAERPLEEIRVMYGSPTMTYQTSGRVKGENGNAIKSAQIKLTEKKRSNE